MMETGSLLRTRTQQLTRGVRKYSKEMGFWFDFVMRLKTTARSGPCYC